MSVFGKSSRICSIAVFRDSVCYFCLRDSQKASKDAIKRQSKDAISAVITVQYLVSKMCKQEMKHVHPLMPILVGINYY